MKSIQEFLSELTNLDIRLYLDGERLRCNAPKAILTADLQAEISDRKIEICQFLKQVNFAANPIAQIQPIPRDRNLPLSFGQQGLWFIDQLAEGNTANYHQLFAIHLQGEVNLAVLERSLTEIVRRHEILRTTFKTINGQAFQAINPKTNLQLEVVDLQLLPKTQQWNELKQLALTESRQPFNLAGDSLLRVKRFQLAPTDNVLLFSIHHAIADGWSGTIIIQELAAIYAAFSIGKPSPLPELPIQYADFAYWQHQKLQQLLPAQRSYWEQKLAGTPILQLPSDRPRPSVQTFWGNTIVLELDADLTIKLKQLSQKSGVTLFMTLLAAFNTLLYRYTSQEDICIGTSVANRHRRDLEALIGYFLNTLVMRTDLSGDPSFQELLQRVQTVAWEAYSHQDLPFDQLVKQLQPQRDLSYSPLFQVMFVLENAPKAEVQIPGLTLSYLEMPMATANFDLSLSMRETEQGLLAKFEYNSDLFDAATIRRMTGHFQTLLQGIVANSDRRLSELPLLTQAEQHQLLVDWHPTRQESSTNCIHQLFEAQVERSPEAIAVICDNEQLTYKQLNDRANQLAHYLQQLGVGSEVLVGICIERSLEMVVGLLGILKAGGAYVPLDPAYPQERLSYLLSDSQVSVLLTQQQLLTSLPASNARIVCLDNWQDISQHSKENLVSSATSKNLAYVIYTSGSTGQPKGVTVEHQSLVNLTQAIAVEYEITNSDRLLQFASISFDVAAEEIYPCLATGATLVLRTEEMLASIPAFLQKCQDWSLTILNLPTAYWQQWMAEVETSGLAIPNIRLVIIGGEQAHLEKVTIWQKIIGDRIQLINAYGLTETTVTSTIYKLPSSEELFGSCVQSDPPKSFSEKGTKKYFPPLLRGARGDLNNSTTNQQISQPLPIGGAIAGIQTYVLDRHLQLVSIGVTGELYIGGAIARGYLNRPDLTQEKFISNPFEQGEGNRLYKTGDLVRYLPDGNIEFLGRIDDSVKIRGFRIEIGEIEAVLSQHPQVRETAVTVSEEQGNKRLVAYIVAQEQISSNELRRFLKEKLPDFMIPSAFVNLKALPLTPNGKIDRRALPALDTAITPETSFVSPHNALELQLVQIWSEVLGVRRIGIQDNFFELGGDSIIAIQIVSRANQAGIKLTTKQLFQYQTIAELATVAVQKSVIQTEQGLVTGSFSLTPIQHWFFEQNLLEPHHWNQTFVLEVPQLFDLDLLSQALQHLLLHHDALRLKFESTQFGWQQVIADNTSVTLKRFDFSGLTNTQQELDFEATVTQLQTSFNLSVAPLIRVAYFDFGLHPPSRLLLSIHHLVMDMFSWRILLADLQTAYQQLEQGKNIQLSAKTTSFKYWSQHLHEYAQSVTLQKEWDYWLTKCQNAIALLPVDFPNGDNTVASAKNISISLNTQQTQALLQEVPSAYNTQINDVLLTALVQAFSQWTGKRSLLVALESHGREAIAEDLDLSRTVGWFTSMFPVHLDLGKSAHPGEALKTIKEQLRSIPHRGIGYSILRYLSQDKEKVELLNLLPQPEVVFNYSGQFDQTFSPSSLFKFVQNSSGLDSSPRNNRSELLEINALIVNGQLQFDLTYNEKIHRHSTVEKLSQDLVEALETLINHCQSLQGKSYTPSDFPELELSQKGLDRFLTKLSRSK